MRRRRFGVVTLAVVAFVVALVATFSLTRSGSPTPTTTTTVTTTTLPASFSVGMMSENWTDSAPGATTENFATGQTTPGRRVETEIFYPTATGRAAGAGAAGAPAREYGPFPVIVFAHGYDLLPATYRAMIDAWVEAGFVVAAPIFPVDNTGEILTLGGSTAATRLGAESDEFNEPGDVAFVVRQLNAAASDTSSKLHGLIDLNRLALAGQSDGANVIGALVYDLAYRSLYDALPVRPMAVALLSGAEFARTSPPDSYASPPDPPAELSVESTGDYCNTQSDAVSLYSKVAGKKWFLVIDGGSHLAPYTGVAPFAAPTEAVTAAFFELELGWRSASAAAASMRTSGDIAGLTRLVRGGNGPSVASPPAGTVPSNPCGLPN